MQRCKKNVRIGEMYIESCNFAIIIKINVRLLNTNQIKK